MLTDKNKTTQDVDSHPLSDPEYPQELSPSALQTLFSACDDFTARRISVGGGETLWLCWLDSSVSGDDVAEQLLRPLTDPARFAGLGAKAAMTAAEEGLVYPANVRRRRTTDDVVSDLTDGSCALLGAGAALCFQLRTKQQRSIESPQVEKTVKGGKDAFTEPVRSNAALVRSRLRTPKLKLKQSVVGRKSRTRVFLLWVDGVADAALVDSVAERLDAIDTDGLIEASVLEEAMADAPGSPFPQLMHTERPDAFSLSLLEGRVGLLVDGLPLGFLLPAALPAMLCSAEDVSQHWLLASSLRALRWAALALSLLLPAFYVAMAMYHQEMIPARLLLSVIESKQSVPFPTSAEILGMLVAFELLQEAGLRLPDSIGQTVSIVGALIVGQSAVEARVISPIAVIVVALAGIAGYTIPNQDLSGALRLWRFALVAAAIAAGMFGVVVATAALLWRLCSLESFGRAYMSGLSTGRAAGVLMRRPERKQLFRPADINGGDRRRRL